MLTTEGFLALDNADIPLYKSKSVPKHVRLWSDVANEPYYKNLVSRVRKQVAKSTRLRSWQELIDAIDSDEGIKRADLV